MDLVNEEHVALGEVRQQRRHVTGARQHRAGGNAQRRAHLRGHDSRERRLAEARRAGEEQVVGDLAARTRRTQHDLQMTHQLALADEVRQSRRAQRSVHDDLSLAGGDE